MINSPHLRPAYVLDRALAYLGKEVADGKFEKEFHLPSIITNEQHLEVGSVCCMQMQNQRVKSIAAGIASSAVERAATAAEVARVLHDRRQSCLSRICRAIIASTIAVKAVRQDEFGSNRVFELCARRR